jgi:hypothetical protein
MEILVKNRRMSLHIWISSNNIRCLLTHANKYVITMFFFGFILDIHSKHDSFDEN